jgi:hypothetical protein
MDHSSSSTRFISVGRTQGMVLTIVDETPNPNRGVNNKINKFFIRFKKLLCLMV